jgi:hypothetical protein
MKKIRPTPKDARQHVMQRLPETSRTERIALDFVRRKEENTGELRARARVNKIPMFIPTRTLRMLIGIHVCGGARVSSHHLYACIPNY